MAHIEVDVFLGGTNECHINSTLNKVPQQSVFSFRQSSAILANAIASWRSFAVVVVATDSMAEKQIEERQNPSGAFPVLFDHSLVYQPPTQLVVPGTPSSQHTARERRDSFSDSSLSDNNNDEQQVNNKADAEAVQNNKDDGVKGNAPLDQQRQRAKQRPEGRRAKDTKTTEDQSEDSSSYDEDPDDGVRSG